MVLRFSILAAAFLLSCTGIERDSVCDEKSIKYNGCAGGVSPSSSSIVPSSSSVPTQTNVVPGPDVNYGGEVYKSVVIGTQTWMARNLNYDASGSRCHSNNATECIIYGRLYDWETAMNLPGCNSTSCSLKIDVNHKGICPEDWHIPSNVDWDALMTAVGGEDTAGRILKATASWNSGGNGLDKYGFMALPGGYYSGGLDGTLANFGSRGYLWSATEYDAFYAYYRGIRYDDEGVSKSNSNKGNFLFNVRCVKDD